MPTTEPPVVEFSAAEAKAKNPDAPYGVKKDGTPRAKPGRKAAAERRAAKKPVRKRSSGKKKVVATSPARSQRNGTRANRPVSVPKNGYTEREAMELLRVGYSVENVAKRTGY